VSRTALLVPVPRVESLIDPWRRRYDDSAAGGVPAHVTVLSPWLVPASVTVDDMTALAAIAADHPVFTADLAHVGLFEDGEVLHLRPDPDDGFRSLTTAVHTRWPSHPPYGGKHGEPTPHVTVGHRIPHREARQASRSLMLALPVRVHAQVLQVWVEEQGHWHAARSFPLGCRA
jgi:hypothetical protein